MLTDTQLKKYFEGNAVHRSYSETEKLMKELKIHADGEVPEEIIKCRRPSESLETLAYREKIYVPKTKNPIGKVISSLSKIRRSPDWSVNYDPKTISAKIIEEERLQEYCEKAYPGHTSVTNWVFSVLLKTQAVDANAVVLVVPMNPDAVTRNEYLRPVAMVFNSNQVRFFEEGADYAILQSSERSSLVADDVDAASAKVFYVCTLNDYSKWEQDAAGFAKTQYLAHNTGRLPAFKVKAQFLKQKENSIIQESRLAPMLPSLIEAAREYSDLQAAVVQHMHPLFWYLQSKECPSCTAGKVIKNGHTENCTVCGGSGKIKFSPYAHIEVEPPQIGAAAVPFTQPAGYIARDTEIMRLQDERVKGHLLDALSSVNMQFLDQTPLAISGEAKQTDREELNNFVYAFAEDLVQTMDQIYWWINEWRYALIVPDRKARQAMLPRIPVPEQFDLLPADYLMDDISKARTAKVSPLLIGVMERDFAVKKFYTSPQLADEIAAVYDLDPLPGYSVDEKMVLIMNKGATQEDFVMSTYLPAFVKQALAEDPGFLSRDRDAKLKKLTGFAQDKIKANDDAAKAKFAQTLDQQMQMSQNTGDAGTGQNNKGAFSNN